MKTNKQTKKTHLGLKLKAINKLMCKAKIIQLLEENIGENIFKFEIGKISKKRQKKNHEPLKMIN